MGHQWRNIFYLELTGSAVTVNDLTSLASDIAGLWNTNMGANISDLCILTQVQIVFIPSVGSELVGVWNGSHPGGSGNAPVADAAACAVIDFHISAYYRGGHPHLQQPGITDTQVTNGSDLASTVQAAFATAWNNIRNGINALTYTSITAVTMGVLSFAHANAWRATPVFFPYQSVSVRQKIGSVRRRITS